MSRNRADEPMNDLQVDVENLYLEETFTDLEVGTIKRLTPVKADGTPDPTRPPRFFGQAQLMTRAGPLPLEVPIDARTLKEAAEKFGQAVEQAMQRLAEQVERYQIEQAKQIIVPGSQGFMPPPPGAGAGGPNNLILR